MAKVKWIQNRSRAGLLVALVVVIAVGAVVVTQHKTQSSPLLTAGLDDAPTTTATTLASFAGEVSTTTADVSSTTTTTTKTTTTTGAARTAKPGAVPPRPTTTAAATPKTETVACSWDENFWEAEPGYGDSEVVIAVTSYAFAGHHETFTFTYGAPASGPSRVEGHGNADNSGRTYPDHTMIVDRSMDGGTITATATTMLNNVAYTCTSKPFRIDYAHPDMVVGPTTTSAPPPSA